MQRVYLFLQSDSEQSALKQRYGDYLLPEQYRKNINQVSKTPKETLTEYASRVG
jgi:hypothetical protein